MSAPQPPLRSAPNALARSRRESGAPSTMVRNAPASLAATRVRMPMAPAPWMTAVAPIGISTRLIWCNPIVSGSSTTEVAASAFICK